MIKHCSYSTYAVPRIQNFDYFLIRLQSGITVTNSKQILIFIEIYEPKG